MKPGSKVYESEIEDYLEAYHWEVSGDEVWWRVGRQVAVPHGRVDLLMYDGQQLLIMELKAGPLQAKDVCQVLRYQSDIRELIHHSFKFYEKDGKAWGAQRYAGNALSEYMRGINRGWLQSRDTADEPLTAPVLIGSEAPEEVVAAIEAVGGYVYIWNLEDDGKFTLDLQFSRVDRLTKEHIEQSGIWLDEYHGVVCDNASLDAQIEQDLLTYRLFGEAVLGRHDG